jgi:hypothetical protein
MIDQRDEIQLCKDVMRPILEALKDRKTVDAEHVKRVYEGVRVENTTLRTELAVEKFIAQMKARAVRPVARRRKA